ncbi:MAG: glycosyltransferase, partial [Alphaproteobacteria bacterium]|nr:glycosyltransferase [Alphaproteobacteria bacterium]
VLEIAGRRFAAGQRIVTFVNRNLEPYRGYHVFMRALPRLLAKVPDTQVLIVGGDGVSYGIKPPDGISYKDRYLAEMRDQLDLSRVHFLGRVPYDTYLKVLQVSAAHVYLTYPFALSWSLLEAMAAECAIVASRTGPVPEAIEDGKSGVLVDFFDRDGLADAVAAVLEKPAAYRAMRTRARAKVLRDYALAACVKRHADLVERY